MSGNKIDGKQLIQDSKDKTEGKKKMKISDTKKTVIKTLVVTFLILGSIGTSFYFGMKYEQDVNNRVHSEVKALTASVTKASLKQ